MFTHVVTTGSFTLAAGETLTGGTSGATGIIEATSTASGLYILSNVKGTFVAGETVTDETGNSATIAADANARNLFKHTLLLMLNKFHRQVVLSLQQTQYYHQVLLIQLMIVLNYYLVQLHLVIVTQLL
jgi:hypothetical protein